MISGAARAEAAVLVIDAKEGVRENSRRHGYILSMLGIRQVVVCVNKMDLVGYDEAHFQAHREGVPRVPRGHRRGQPAAVHPGRARSTARTWPRAARRCPGTTGPTLLETAGRASPRRRRKIDQPLRMPVQAVYKFTSTATIAASSPAASRPGR